MRALPPGRPGGPAEARLSAAPAFATIGVSTHPMEEPMTPEEQMLLDEANGRADAAESLARALFQALGDLNIIPPAHMLEMLDLMLLALDEVPDAEHSNRTAWQRHALERLRADLRGFPNWRRKPEPGDR